MEYQIIHGSELKKFMTDPEVLLIDLRSAAKYRRFHLRSAVNYPYEKKEFWKGTLDKKKKLLFYCDRGNDSIRIASELAGNGYRIYTLAGGLHRLKNYR